MNNLTFRNSSATPSNKRVGAVFLAICMATSILTSCAATTPSNAASTATTSTSGKLEEVTLTIFGGTDPGLVPKDASQTAVGKIIKEKFNIKMEVLPVPSNYTDLTTVWLASNDYPDIVNINGLSLLNQYIDADIAICLDDYKNLLPNFFKVHADQIDIWRSQATDGKLYKWENGTPVSLEGQLGDYDIMVRSDLLEQQGWPNITYTSDLLKFYKTALEKNPTTNGSKTIGVTFSGGEGGSYITYPFQLVEKGDKYKWQSGDYTIANYKDYRFEYAWDLPQTKESVQFFNKLYQAGLLDKEAYSLKDTDVLEKMKNGQVMTNLYNRWNTGPANAALRSKKITNMEYVELPIRLDSQKDTKLIQLLPATKVAENRILTKNCKNIERVLALIDWWSTDEAQLLHGSGIEGVDYKYQDGKRTPLEPFSNFLKGTNPTWAYTGGYLESFLFTYLGGRYDNYSGDGQPYRLTKDPTIVSTYGLSDRQKQVYKALGWSTAKSWYYDNANVVKDSVLATISIPKDSKFYDIMVSSKEIVERYSSKIVFSDSDAAFEKNWDAFIGELNGIHAKSVVEEKNKLLAAKIAKK